MRRFKPQPIPKPGFGSLDPERTLGRGPPGSASPERPEGQTELTVSVYDLERLFWCPTASLLEDLGSSHRATTERVTAPTRAGPKTSRVLLSSRCQIVVCPDLAIGQEGSPSVNLPIGSPLGGGRGLVGRGGVEPPTSRLSGVRSNHLSYRPKSHGPAGPRSWWSLPGSNR